jgi:pimeloyl-ACP methyl ester carboxylesterase
MSEGRADGRNTVPRDAQRLRKDESWRVHEVACGHDLMVDDPQAVARLLASLA